MKAEQVDGTGKRFNKDRVTPASIPPGVLAALAAHCALGEIKYPDDGNVPNWAKGQSYTTLLNSLERHLLAFKAGETNDADLGDHHLVAVLWNAMALLFFEQNPEFYAMFDDRPWKGTNVETYLDSGAVNRIRKAHNETK